MSSLCSLKANEQMCVTRELCHFYNAEAKKGLSDAQILHVMSVLFCVRFNVCFSVLVCESMRF